jgi:repressor LexA
VSDFGKRVRKRREHLGMSQDELALLLGYSDKSSISKIENSQRDIYRGKVVEFAEALKTTPSYLMGWTDDVLGYNLLQVTTRKIPIIGNVHCGVPEYAEEDFLDIVDSDIRADFALRATGDSMIGAGIEEGDLVFVRKQPTINSGELAVVLIKDEAAIKRVYMHDSYISLSAENPAYAPIVIKENEEQEVFILGKVVAHMHFYKERKHND